MNVELNILKFDRGVSQYFRSKSSDLIGYLNSDGKNTSDISVAILFINSIYAIIQSSIDLPYKQFVIGRPDELKM